MAAFNAIGCNHNHFIRRIVQTRKNIFQRKIPCSSRSISFSGRQLCPALNLFTDDPNVVRQVRDDLLIKGQNISNEIFKAEDGSFRDIFSARIAQYL